MTSEIARKLGAVNLAGELERALAETATESRPEALISSRSSSYSIVPRSRRPRLSIVLRRRLARGLSGARALLGPARRSA